MSKSLRASLSLALIWSALACSGDDDPSAEGPAAAAGAGGAGAPAAGADAGGGASNSAAGASAAGGGVAGSAAAGRGAAGSGAAGSGTAAGGATGGGAAGSGAAGGGAAAPAPARPTECNGKTFPPRAVGKAPPFAVGPEAGGLPAYWPTDAWKTETPDKLGFDPAKLMAAAEFETQYSNTQGVLVIRHGYIALETYSGSFNQNTTHESYSMAKSFTSGLIGIAIAEGKLSGTDAKICEAYPMQWDCGDPSDPRSRITVEHAMNLSTGLRWEENWRSTATGTNDAYSLNILDTVLSREAVEEPGITKRYSTGDPALLTGVLQRATGMTAYEYGKQKIFDVIGASSIRWNQDRAGRTTTYAGLQATARDYAKYGYLYLRGGQWDGQQIIPADWIARTTQAAKPCEDWNQWLWHVNPPVRLGTQDPACEDLFCLPTEFADLPPEAFFAEGINGQFMFVLPSADLLIVRLAMDQAGSERWDDFARGFLDVMLDAIVK